MLLRPWLRRPLDLRTFCWHGTSWLRERHHSPSDQNWMRRPLSQGNVFRLSIGQLWLCSRGMFAQWRKQVHTTRGFHAQTRGRLSRESVWSWWVNHVLNTVQHSQFYQGILLWLYFLILFVCFNLLFVNDLMSKTDKVYYIKILFLASLMLSNDPHFSPKGIYESHFSSLPFQLQTFL